MLNWLCWFREGETKYQLSGNIKPGGDQRENRNDSWISVVKESSRNGNSFFRVKLAGNFCCLSFRWPVLPNALRGRLCLVLISVKCCVMSWPVSMKYGHGIISETYGIKTYDFSKYSKWKKVILFVATW